MEKDIVFKFWEKYREADILERREIIRNNPAMMGIGKRIDGLTDEQHNSLHAQQLMSFFDDLIEYMEAEHL